MGWWVENTKGFVQLSYIEHFLILVFRTTGCISISDFASLFGVPVGIKISTIWFNNYSTIRFVQ